MSRSRVRLEVRAWLIVLAVTAPGAVVSVLLTLLYHRSH